MIDDKGLLSPDSTPEEIQKVADDMVEFGRELALLMRKKRMKSHPMTCAMLRMSASGAVKEGATLESFLNAAANSFFRAQKETS